ncbi:MAG: glucose 1-dehydrogenase [Chlamydiae bacterium]|nr:glucose 1-dehydrogenase [Chlamydiota bacterium]
MKAISLIPGTTTIQLKDWPEPAIQSADEIKVKVLEVGICGTDREEVRGGRADAPPGEKELIIGHEMLSRIVEIGKGVSEYKPGDLVVISVRRECSHCLACKIHRSDLCISGDYTERGIKGRHGFHAEYVVDKMNYAIKVAESIRKIGVLAEPMSVVQKAVEEAEMVQMARLPYLKNPFQGKTALIAGLGPIGLLAALALRLRSSEIIGLDIVDEISPRIQILKEIGGKYFNAKKGKIEELEKRYPNIDFIFDAAGIAKLDFDLLNLLGINGIFILTGVPGDQRLIDIDGAALMRKLVLKNQVMVGSVNESIQHFKKGIQDLQKAVEKWPGVVEKMITNRFPHAEFKKAFASHSPDEIKVVINWEK